jgi:hypothetical protein
MLGGLDGRKHPSGHIQFGLSHNKHGAQSNAQCRARL